MGLIYCYHNNKNLESYKNPPPQPTPNIKNHKKTSTTLLANTFINPAATDLIKRKYPYSG